VDVIPKMRGTAPSPRGRMWSLGPHLGKAAMQWSSSEDCNMLDDHAAEASIKLANLDLGRGRCLITIDDGLSMPSPTLVRFKVTETADSSAGPPPPQPQPTCYNDAPGVLVLDRPAIGTCLWRARRITSYLLVEYKPLLHFL
jgi:hypothetical protein